MIIEIRRNNDRTGMEIKIKVQIKVKMKIHKQK